MNSSDIARQRLHHQRIMPPTCETPHAVVSWMGAMQAQDYYQAVWAIGARIPSATLQTIEQAIENGEILRTWPQRGTIHWVAPEHIKWMLQLGAARMIARDAQRLAQLDLDVPVMQRIEPIFREALAGKKRLTRVQMFEVLGNAGIHTNNQRGYHILWYMAQTGVICIGPMRGKEQTFALLDDWTPNTPILPREEALAALAKLYFTSHGFATIHDFAWWTGLTITEARKGFESIKSQFVSETIGKKTYWMHADHTAPPDHPRGVVLLPGFDEYLLGYQDRSDVLDPLHASKVVPGGNGVFFPMIVIDGQIEGTWKRTIKRDKVIITRDTFRPLTDQKRAEFEIAAQRYAAFHGLVLA